MCGKFQGPPTNGASLDRFLMANWAIHTKFQRKLHLLEWWNGPFIKTGCYQTAQNGPILKKFWSELYKVWFMQGSCVIVPFSLVKKILWSVILGVESTKSWSKYEIHNFSLIKVSCLSGNKSYITLHYITLQHVIKWKADNPKKPHLNISYFCCSYPVSG